MTVAVPEPPHLVTDLKTLCLATMTAEWRPLAAQATRERQPPAEYLAQLVHLEVTGRRERRIQRRLQEARFPMLKTLDAFQFDAQPELDRDAILQLCSGAFVTEAANVVLVGGVGTGKTHLAIALGMACCQHDYRVRFLTAAELTTLLVEAQQQGRLARKLDQLARFDVVIVDELGYVPFDKAGADLLFGFISRRYERGSLVVTNQSAVRPLVRGVPGCDRRRGRHRPYRAPCHRADDQRGQLPPHGRPTEPDVPRSTEENALMGTRRDDHPTEGSLFTLPQGPFSPCHFQPRRDLRRTDRRCPAPAARLAGVRRALTRWCVARRAPSDRRDRPDDHRQARPGSGATEREGGGARGPSWPETGESLDQQCATATVVRTSHRRMFALVTARNAWTPLGALHPAGVSGRVGTSGLLSRGSQVRILPGVPFPKENSDFGSQKNRRRMFTEQSDQSGEFAPELPHSTFLAFPSFPRSRATRSSSAG